MPESDQTRWMGIRPTTDDTDIIPVTVTDDAVNVNIVGGGGGGLMPGAPVHVEWRGLNRPTDTWYTIEGRIQA
ncbi:unnamed protein product, partial [marine sediment metagenome]